MHPTARLSDAARAPIGANIYPTARLGDAARAHRRGHIIHLAARLSDAARAHRRGHCVYIARAGILYSCSLTRRSTRPQAWTHYTSSCSLKQRSTRPRARTYCTAAHLRDAQARTYYTAARLSDASRAQRRRRITVTFSFRVGGVGTKMIQCCWPAFSSAEPTTHPSKHQHTAVSRE
jgi:hypothetical protein